MKLIAFTGIFFLACLMHAQTVINGSFESTSSPSSCNYNISNATYNTQMSNSSAFGLYQSVDIVISGCYVPSIPDGTYAVAIANNPNNSVEGEAISIELSSPLVIGQGYEISFQSFANTDFGPQGDLLIGVSTSNNTFGDIVDTANTVVNTWTSFTFNFVAQTNATHITAMQVPGISSWNFLDDFSIMTTCSPTTGTDVINTCGSYTWIDGNTYTASNNSAIDTLVNASGCDSIVTLDLTIDNVSDITTATTGITISANNTHATYQWLDCETNYTVISGETGQSFTPSVNGLYAVQLTENGCIDTSACTAVTTVNILETNFEHELKLYPNPNNGQFSIDLGEGHSIVQLTMTDLNGRIIESSSYSDTELIDIEMNEPAGVYLIIIQSSKSKAILRMVKQ